VGGQGVGGSEDTDHIDDELDRSSILTKRYLTEMPDPAKGKS
jgi:hypothetical protein